MHSHTRADFMPKIPAQFAVQPFALLLASWLILMSGAAHAQDNPFGGGGTGGASSLPNPFGGAGAAQGGQGPPFGGSAPGGTGANPFGGAAPPAPAQNPFGAAGNPGAPPAAGTPAGPAGSGGLPPIDPQLSPASRLVVETVRAKNPRTAEELAKAAKAMFYVRQFPDARIYMGMFSGLQVDDETMFELELLLGDDFLLEVYTHEEVQPQGNAFSNGILSAARRAATSSQRIQRLIGQLSAGNRSLRSEAFYSLKQIGSPATAEMIHVFTDAARIEEYPYIRGALQHMGDSAVRPLVAAAHADDAQVQLEAVRALEHYPSEDAADAIIRLFLSTRVPEALRQFAFDTISSRYDFTRDRNAAIDRLQTRAREYLTGLQKLPPNETSLEDIWQWDSATSRLQRLVVPRLTAAQLMAAERAADLLDIAPELRESRQLYLLTALEAQKRVNGPDTKVSTEDFSDRGPVGSDEIGAVLREALDLKLMPAAAGACELLEQIGGFQHVQSSGSQPGILVEALLQGDRHVQFAAFEAIAAIDPKTAYTGNSYVTKLAFFLAGTQGGGAVLVGHKRIGFAQSYAGALGAADSYPLVADNGRDFLNTALGSPDIEAIFITDSMTRPDYIELAQQLRSDWRTLRTPICMLVSGERGDKRASNLLSDDPFMIVLPATFDSVAMARHMSEIRRMQQPWPVTPGQRRLHANAALRWLARIAADKDAYGFYEIGEYERSLVNMLYTPNAGLSSKVLASFGTSSSQQELVRFANQNTIPVGDRKLAAEAFKTSVARAGLRLSREQILKQYDRYNASEFENRDSQEILGEILDTIETKLNRKRTSANSGG